MTTFSARQGDVYLERVDSLPAGLEGFDALSDAGWWWPFAGAVVMTDRPVRLCRDEQGRLHSTDGMALGYADGYGIYAIHGLRVPAQVVMDPLSLDPKQIIAERNAEVRRVMIERYTPERFIRTSGAALLHKDDWGELYRQEVPGDEPVVMVHVVNSSPEPDGSYHNHWLQVPPTMQRAHEAVAWTCHRTAKTYQPVVQT